MKAFFALSICLLASHFLAAQRFLQATVTLRDGTTESGQIAYGFWGNTPQHIRFKSGSGGARVYRAEDINGFEVRRKDGKIERFVRKVVAVNRSLGGDLNDLDIGPEVKMEADTVFLQVLLASDLSLLELVEGGRAHFFAMWQDSTYELIYKRYYRDENARYRVYSNDRYRRQLGTLAYEYPALRDQLPKLLYNESALLRWVADFNNARNAPLRYLFAPERLRPQLYALVGATYTSFEARGELSEPRMPIDSQASFQPTVGLGVALSVARTNRRLFFYNDLTFRRLKVESRAQRTTLAADGGLVQRPIQKIDITHLRLQTGVRWVLNRHSDNRFFVQVGANNAFAFSNLSTRVAGGSVPLEEDFWDADLKKYEFGLGVGVGASLGRIGLELRYDRGDGFSPYIGLSTPTQTATAFLSWRF
jgi:hypothetical protein